MNTPKDPTRKELIAHIEGAYPAITCEGEPHTADSCPEDCPCRFDIEEAAYYAAVHCHGGQWSNLYAAQCASPFTPGMCAPDLPDDEERPAASDLYRDAVEWIMGEPYAEEQTA